MRDLRHLIGKAADEAGLSAVSQGLTLYVDIDPALRGAWSLDETLARETVEAFAAVTLLGRWGEARFGARLGPGRLELTAHAPAGVLDAEALRGLARRARALGGKLDVQPGKEGLAWRLLAPISRPIPRLLYVDEVAAARVEVAAMAGDLGWRCDAADAGGAELRLARGESFDAVLISLEADGALPLAQAASRYPFAPAMIALAREGVSGWALREVGFLGLVRRPLDARRLSRALASVDAAEFVEVQRADRDDEDGDDKDRKHGAAS